MKKNLFYLICLSALLCLFAACSKDNKDEPEIPRGPIPFFELVGEKPYEWGITLEINGEAQPLSIFAHSNMEDVWVQTSIDAPWVEYKEMIRRPEKEEIEFVFNIYPNPSGTERTCYITLGSPPGTEEMWLIVPRTVTLNQTP